jgi:hypothetical protein
MECKKSLPSMNKKYFARPNSSFPLPVPPCCQMTADYTVKELWWTSHEFSSVDITTP